MTTSSIKRRRSPHDAPASNDGDDDDALEMENNDIEPQNNSITSNRRSSRSSSTTSSDGSVLASATSVAAAAAAVSVSGDAFDAADRINRINSNLGKRDSEEDSWASKGYSYINPFVHRIQIDSHIEVAKVSFLFLTSLPHYHLITPLFLFILFSVNISVRVHSCKTAQKQLLGGRKGAALLDTRVNSFICCCC